MFDSSPQNAHRAFTILQVLVVLGAIVVLLVLAVMFIARGALHTARITYCGGNVRGIAQGLVLFAQSNKDQYPLPSVLDAANATVNVEASTKDTTANIISTMIYGTFFGPEICHCVGETNSMIRQITDFEYSAPKTAANPALALWDPKFSADFTSSQGGNFSYAHVLPSGKRLDRWTNTFQASEALIGDRAPLITGATKDNSRGVTPIFNTASKSSRNHGSRGNWSGNIAYNDNHVNFETTMWGNDDKAKPIAYTANTGIAWPDLLHYDEPDDKLGTNNFLGIFTTSGKTPQEFKSIWD